MVETAHKFEDWGVAADLLHYMTITKNLLPSIQKSTSSSWTLPLLTKVMPYVNNVSKHWGVLKVSLTLKGWVPSPPVLSGPHVLIVTMKKNLKDDVLDVGVDSKERVM
jgi:hypothetical protein